MTLNDQGHDLDAVFTLQQKYATEFQLVTAAMLDRERTAHYSVKIRCQDGGGAARGRGQRASRVTEKTLLVHVTDVNDNAPTFSKQTYHGSIVENSFVGASVLQVHRPNMGIDVHCFLNSAYYHKRCMTLFIVPTL